MSSYPYSLRSRSSDALDLALLVISSTRETYNGSSSVALDPAGRSSSITLDPIGLGILSLRTTLVAGASKAKRILIGDGVAL
jgi:hypothetical protein